MNNNEIITQRKYMIVRDEKDVFCECETGDVFKSIYSIENSSIKLYSDSNEAWKDLENSNVTKDKDSIYELVEVSVVV